MDAHRRAVGLNSRGYERACRGLVDRGIAEGTPCGRCGEPVDAEITRLSRIPNGEYWNHRLGGTAGHIISVIDAPHLAKVMSNHQLEHRSCNCRDGQRISTQRKKWKNGRDWLDGTHTREW